jgi:transglutaminase-like putative cysteine protease
MGMARFRDRESDRGQDSCGKLAEAGMIARLLRKLLSVEVLGPVLVIASLQMLTYGVSSSLPGTDVRYLFAVCLLAAALGWVLSRSKLGVFSSLLLVAILGLVGIWIIGARLFLPLMDWFKAVIALAPQLIPAIREKVPVDVTQVQAAWSVTAQASSALWVRWMFWLKEVGGHVAVSDALVRNMIWSFVMWCLAAWTGWFAARRNAIRALLPGIILMALILSYSEYRIYSLWMMVVLMLLLMGVWNYKNHTLQWERRRVDYSDSILYDNAQAVIFLALLVGTISFSIPSISWRAIRDAFQNRNKNEAAEVLGIRKQTASTKSPDFQKPSLPREHLLSEGFEESRELVMIIRTGELQPVPVPSLVRDAPQHYWRGTIYDQYQGTGWVTSGTSSQNYRANAPLIPGLLDHYSLLHMDVTIRKPEGRLFWSGILYSASVPFRADWRLRPKSDLFADQSALLQSDIFTAASGAAAYQAETYVPQVTIQQLRSASTEYPDYIHTRYLQLPYELPLRVRQLATEITGGIDNPYDKAKAIESFLRRTSASALEIPAPPAERDVTDYFLFDLKKGYCDYYATAMVVLARASGLPARFVSGYSSGSYDAINAEYIVRELNAHSWAEIYFPEIGWIEFEPTASQPEIKRMEKQAEIPVAVPPATQTQKFLFKLSNTGILYWVSSLALVLLLIVLYFAVIERFWILNRAPQSAIALLYRRYYRMGRPLAGVRTRAETAIEFTSRLLDSIEGIDVPARQSQRSTSIKENAWKLTTIYLLSLFSNHEIEKTDARNALALWRRLRLQLRLARLQGSLLRFRNRIMGLRSAVTKWIKT